MIAACLDFLATFASHAAGVIIALTGTALVLAHLVTTARVLP